MIVKTNFIYQSNKYENLLFLEVNQKKAVVLSIWHTTLIFSVKKVALNFYWKYLTHQMIIKQN